MVSIHDRRPFLRYILNIDERNIPEEEIGGVPREQTYGVVEQTHLRLILQ